MITGWRFPPLSGGNEQGYTNSGSELFKGEKLFDNLAREICQNSLDAKDNNADGPVMVEFRLLSVKTSDYNVFSEYDNCIDGCINYWQQDEQEMDEKLKKFIARAKSTLSETEIAILVASDYNTSGLIGSRNNRGAWKALTHSDGISRKSDLGSAGSYGIGKGAPFACSNLGIVFYNTFAKDEVKAFKGVSRLATTLDRNDEPTQGIGHYQKHGEKAWEPIFAEDPSSFRDIFERKAYGTDIIIVGFNESDNWAINIEKAVINHFFPAIHEGRLVIRVDGHVIDSVTLGKKINEEFVDDKETRITAQLYDAMISPDRKELLSILQPNDAELFIKSASNYGRTIATFRAMGMRIAKPRSKIILQRYAAVFIARGQDLNELLKETEPPKHDKWDYQHIEKHDKDKRRRAKDCIERINRSIHAILKQQYETISESTVDSDTGEYIPDENAIFGQISSGNDVLRVRYQLGRIRTKTDNVLVPEESAKTDEGAPKEVVAVHNEGRHPDPQPVPPLPLVDPGGGIDTLRGLSFGEGTKTVLTPNLLKQKVCPLSPDKGLYKAIIKPRADFENVFITFSSVGEDGTSEKLEISYYMFLGRKATAVLGQVGPLALHKDTSSEVVVCFENKERMVVRMSVVGGRVA